ncbi:MAG TPA: hypothetical protein VK982_11460 [Bacteroidales bacterium]|nr:hypothetical protein [Bacteroidales bacterium]
MNWDKYLKDKGFKKVYLSDKSGYWYELSIKNKFIKNLHISVEPDRKNITVWATEPKNLNARMDYTFAIIHKKLTKKNLWHILFVVQEIKNQSELF